MTTGDPLPPLPPAETPPTRDVWPLFAGLLVSIPLFGLLLLEVPPGWKGVMLVTLVVVLFVLLRRMRRRSRQR
ncbi:MAG: hypothetical protein ACRDIV_15640 [Ktedonobacteraceae bacterium]